MNSIYLLFLNSVVAVLSFNQLVSDTDQWKSSNIGAEQSYNQVLEQYLNYYNYLYQQNCILNNQNYNVNTNPISTNITNTNPIPSNTTNIIPISVLKMENRSTNNKHPIALPIVRPIFPRKNKILLPRKPNIELMKPLKPKIRSILCKSQNKSK
ncbi:uncharacterized protein LOC114119619 [Aphis gossypii]|uniref:uncharacterized protein LOC114119619 n=1 Tax=Aphis gossypii TaxID=80765 RepID=UPI00100FA68D|nr:uncharacterized protein LOC114119619 [Aphis gossypii]